MEAKTNQRARDWLHLLLAQSHLSLVFFFFSGSTRHSRFSWISGKWRRLKLAVSQVVCRPDWVKLHLRSALVPLFLSQTLVIKDLLLQPFMDTNSGQ